MAPGERFISLAILFAPLKQSMLTASLHRQFVHGQTYQAHPMVCAAAMEVQRIIQEQDLVANAKKLGELLESKLKNAFADHPNVGNIRGRGLFWAVSSMFLYDV